MFFPKRFGGALAAAASLSLFASVASASSSAAFVHDPRSELSDSAVEVGYCAATPAELVREEPLLVLFRDGADNLRVSEGKNELEAPTAQATMRKEAHYSIQAKGFHIELTGLRLALVDGVRYLVFDARARTKRTEGRFVALACRIAAERLRARLR